MQDISFIRLIRLDFLRIFRIGIFLLVIRGYALKIEKDMLNCKTENQSSL